jgi:lysophospholipase L1-like esterase
MLADPIKKTYRTIIWAGRNNYTDPTTVKADIAAMVAALGHTNYIVLSILNGSGTNEWAGQANYLTLTQLNADLAAIYGTHYLDVRSYLVSLYNPLDAQDVIDHGHDVPPTSLRFDGIHLNDAGYAAVANLVYSNRGQLGVN